MFDSNHVSYFSSWIKIKLKYYVQCYRSAEGIILLIRISYDSIMYNNINNGDDNY